MALYTYNRYNTAYNASAVCCQSLEAPEKVVDEAGKGAKRGGEEATFSAKSRYFAALPGKEGKPRRKNVQKDERMNE